MMMIKYPSICCSTPSELSMNHEVARPCCFTKAANYFSTKWQNRDCFFLLWWYASDSMYAPCVLRPHFHALTLSLSFSHGHAACSKRFEESKANSTVGKSTRKNQETTLQGTNISPPKWHFEDYFPFPQVGYVNSLEGILMGLGNDHIGEILVDPRCGFSAENWVTSPCRPHMENHSVVEEDWKLQ